ncbi:MAG TPA: UDP-N-acetylmuramoyl-L-alanine--D-glutamate ligase [Candidatus Saccharimonadia bacterium]
MNIRELNGRNVCILGYGREGQASHRALLRYAPDATVTVADANPATHPEPATELITGPDYLDKLGAFDAIIKTPGLKWHPSGPVAAKLTSGTQLFLDSLPAGTTVIGVTGTKGKSTTSHLIYRALEAAGKDVHLAGNIGEPMLNTLSLARPGSYFVLELSSYQLETLRTSPHIAVVTSFFPDHTDYHGSLAAYLEAKSHIAKFQQPADIVFYNAQYPECQQIAAASAGRQVAFTATDAPSALRHLPNPSNVAAAFLVARECGVPAATATLALEQAGTLPHRQQSLGLIAGIEWIDDSAATTPQSAVAAVHTFGDRIDTIIVGGLDRGYDFAELGQTIAGSSVRHVILFPDTGAKIRQAIEHASGHPAAQFFETSSLPEAVTYAAKHTAPGRICLLASGSPSYNQFKNYYDRGDAFQQAIKNLSQN